MAKGVDERRVERKVSFLFAVCFVAAVALGVVYANGGHPQLEGLLLLVALGAMGAGLVLWANRLLPQGPDVEDREILTTTEEEKGAFEEDLDRGFIRRRKLLVRMGGLALLALGGAAVFPVRSMGPGPGKTLMRTPWKKGSRVVDSAGHGIRADAVRVGALITVFPEGFTEAADAQAVLVKVEEGSIKHGKGRERWTPEGLIVYSKICTHAGCPVGLYQADTHQLICPCHQSAFDVLDGARVVFGPATRALPQLPIEVGEDGVLRAMGDFSSPAGPGFWTLG
ncbi:MAG TPA: Rieske 2Fe-2S domain-containing protein [bacterium]|nr:Rieske 2Fe-2S domain-containing protein [bacterium]